MENCASVRTAIGWNIVQAAGSYAQLAAVVGAVVFAGIVLLLGNPPNDSTGTRGPGFSKALMGLPIVFVSILVTAHLYTVLDGEQDCARAFSIHISAAVAFQLAALGLLLTMSWIFFAYGVTATVLKNANLMFAMLLAVSVFYLYVTVEDANEVLRGADLDTRGSLLVVLVLGAPATAVFSGLVLDAGWIGKSRRVLSFRRTMTVLFVAEILLAAIFALLSDVERVVPQTFPRGWEIGPIVVGGVMAALLTLHLPQATSAPRPRHGWFRDAPRNASNRRGLISRRLGSRR